MSDTATDQAASGAQPPTDLYQVVATAQAERWGYTKTLDPDELAAYIGKQIGDSNLRADVELVWTYARRGGEQVGLPAEVTP